MIDWHSLQVILTIMVTKNVLKINLHAVAVEIVFFQVQCSVCEILFRSFYYLYRVDFILVDIFNQGLFSAYHMY